MKSKHYKILEKMILGANPKLTGMREMLAGVLLSQSRHSWDHELPNLKELMDAIIEDERLIKECENEKR